MDYRRVEALAQSPRNTLGSIPCVRGKGLHSHQDPLAARDHQLADMAIDSPPDQWMSFEDLNCATYIRQRPCGNSDGAFSQP